MFAVVCALTSPAQVIVSPQFFGLNMTSAVVQQADPWGTVQFGSTRLFEDMTSWADINTAPGTYDFTPLDTWLILAQLHNNPDVVLTFGVTPQWASSKPTDTTCAYGPGACDPPSDLNSDGSGTNQMWINFITVLMQHLGTSINNFEMWNTPQDPTQWTGTQAQLVRMAKDARAIILNYNPKAKLLTPPPGAFHVSATSGSCFAANWLGKFFKAGGGQYIDIVSFHGYIGNPPVAEEVIPMVQCIGQTMSTYGQSSKPLWNTEGSYGLNSDLGKNTTTEAAFLGRSVLIQASIGVQRYHWYAWDNGTWGTMWNHLPLKNSIAYGQVYKWLVGATMTRACAGDSNNNWTCPITRTNGYQALAAWNTVGNASYVVPAGFIRYRDLMGHVTKTTGGATITIGISPILLEN
jgi:hypothetical protein